MPAVTLVLALVLALAGAPAAARPLPRSPADVPPPPHHAPLLLPPVDATITRGFSPPESDFGPGHRGIDFGVVPGTLVRAAAPGKVTFAGAVGAVRAVTIAHVAGVETTYSTLDKVLVATGDAVAAGRWIGTVDAAHPGGEGGLHLGVRIAGRYTDPETLLGPLDIAGAVYLVPDAPVHDNPFDPGFTTPRLDDGSRDCVIPQPPPPGAPPPTGNLALVVGGFNAGSDAPVFALPLRLGYAPRDIFRFSYRGLDGPRFFERYDRRDTFGSLAPHAVRLHSLLRRLGRSHPGRAVDVFAHSQGGLVAREALSLLADEWDPSLAPVEHLVTYAAPHRGTHAVTARDILEDGTATLFLLEALRAAGTLDPWAGALDDMAPGSAYLVRLGRSDVVLGARVLALAMPHDVVVPSHRARWESKPARTVPASGLFGHGAVVVSPQADAIAYAFLRDASPCDVADGAGEIGGRVVSAAQRILPALFRGAEDAVKEIVGRHPLGRIALELAEVVAGMRGRRASGQGRRDA